MKPITSTEIGTTGLKRFNGYVSDDFIPELRGRSAMRRYREMRDNSAIIGACFEAIFKLFRQFCWEWEPVDNTKRAKKYARIFNEAFDDLETPVAETVQSVLSMLTFGFDIKERLLKTRLGRDDDPARSSKYDDGVVIWAGFAERAQESTSAFRPWNLSPNGSRILAWSQDDSTGRRFTIPAHNFLHWRTSREKNNPEGRSILRNCWFSWYFFKRISEAEAIGVSRDLAGIPVARVPAEWFAEDALEWQRNLLAQLKSSVTTISRGENEGFVWPTQYDPGSQKPVMDLELLNSGGRRQFDTSAIIERYERRMAMVMLADLLLMGHEATGSFALSDNKTNILELAVKGHASTVRSGFQSDAPLIMDLNGWDRALTPRLCAKLPKQVELGALGDFVSKMVAAGFRNWASDEGIDQVLREAGGLPAAPDRKPASGQPEPPEPPDLSSPSTPDPEDDSEVPATPA